MTPATPTPDQLALLRQIDSRDKEGRRLKLFDNFHDLVNLAKRGGDKTFTVVNSGEVVLTWAGRAELAEEEKK